MSDERQLLLSVIIPAYNAMDTLERCVDSIRRQSIPGMEIIIVDDGSTDNTGALAEKLALIDKRIKVFHKENGGSSSARNVGIDKARGTYLGFVDSDDYIEPDMYEKLLKIAVEENVPMVQTSRDEIAADGTRLPDVCTPPSEPSIFDNRHILRELLLHRGDCSFCTRITHYSLFNDLRFEEGELNEDFYLLVRMLSRVQVIVIIPDQDYHVYYKENSNSRTTDENVFPRVFTDIVVNADRVDKIVDDYFPELKEESFRFGMFQRLDYMLHIPVKQMQHDNSFYLDVKRALRRSMFKALGNKYLTKKNKQYIFVLGCAPKLARSVHRIKMKKR